MVNEAFCSNLRPAKSFQVIWGYLRPIEAMSSHLKSGRYIVFKTRHFCYFHTLCNAEIMESTSNALEVKHTRIFL